MTDKHTPGPYFMSGTSIYSEAAPQDVDHKKYKGFNKKEGGLGYLIAESIPHYKTRALLTASTELLEALETAQKALKVMIDKESILSTTVINAYSMVVEAETKARAVLKKAKGE